MAENWDTPTARHASRAHPGPAALAQQHLVIISVKSGSVNGLAEGVDEFAHLGTLICWRVHGGLECTATVAPPIGAGEGALPLFPLPTPVAGTEATVGIAGNAASQADEPIDPLMGLAALMGLLFLMLMWLGRPANPQLSPKPPEVLPSNPGHLPDRRRFDRHPPY